jgi:hypothetical protein
VESSSVIFPNSLRCFSITCPGIVAQRKSDMRHQSAPTENNKASQTARTSKRSKNPFGFCSPTPMSSLSRPTQAPQWLSTPVTADVPERCMPSTTRERFVGALLILSYQSFIRAKRLITLSRRLLLAKPRLALPNSGPDCIRQTLSPRPPKPNPRPCLVVRGYEDDACPFEHLGTGRAGAARTSSPLASDHAERRGND